MDPVKEFLKSRQNSMDAEGQAQFDIQPSIEVAGYEFDKLDKEEMAIDALETAMRIDEIKGQWDEESSDAKIASAAFNREIGKALALYPGLSAIVAMDGEGERWDATKAFLKTAARQAGLALERLLAMAKKLFLKASAWIAANDDRKKELEKNIAKFSDTTHEMITDFSSNDSNDKLESFIKSNKHTLKMMVVENKLETLSGTVLTVDISGKATETDGLSTFINGLEPDGTNTRVENIANDDKTVRQFIGFDTKYIYIMLFNESFTDPENEDSTEPEVAYALVKYDIEEKVFENDEDATLKTLVKDEFVITNSTDVVDLLKALPKSQKLREKIDKSFKFMDKIKKEADKEFGKDPKTWEGSAKKAQALKATFTSRSKSAFVNGKTQIDIYRSALELASIFEKQVKKKKGGTTEGGTTEGGTN